MEGGWLLCERSSLEVGEAAPGWGDAAADGGAVQQPQPPTTGATLPSRPTRLRNMRC